MRKIVFLAALILSGFGIVATAQSSAAKAEQTTFCADVEPALKPVPLPDSVVKAVMSTKEVMDESIELRNQGGNVVHEGLLRGTTIRLTDSNELFFLVVGAHPLSGADNDWFWIVRNSGKTARVLLFAGGNCVEVARTKKLGYRNVVVSWSSAGSTLVETYVWGGKFYSLRQQKWGTVR